MKVYLEPKNFYLLVMGDGDTSSDIAPITR
jgi:hypothetical protein